MRAAAPWVRYCIWFVFEFNTHCAVGERDISPSHRSDNFNLTRRFLLFVVPSSVLAGQIMHRLRLTWLGEEGSIAETVSTFRTLLSITVVYYVLNQILIFSPFALMDENGNVSSDAVLFVEWRYILRIIFIVFTWITVARLRSRIRSKYSIPEKNCRGCEDCCCSIWCTCCALSQMARHTADYETYAALCCSETGLSPNAPSIV